MKIKNMVVLLTAMVATLLLAFSVSVFAEGHAPGVAAPDCSPGYEAVREPSGKFDCAESPRLFAMPVGVGPTCHNDSDCRADQICVSCSSFGNPTEFECPSGEAICSKGMPK